MAGGNLKYMDDRLREREREREREGEREREIYMLVLSSSQLLVIRESWMG